MPKYARLAASAPGELVAVGRHAQVEGEDLALAQPVLEPQREHHLAQLARGRALAAGEDLHRLLGDGRAALDHPPRAQVVPGGARDGQRVDARDGGRSARPPRPAWRARASRAGGRRPGARLRWPRVGERFVERDARGGPRPPSRRGASRSSMPAGSGPQRIQPPRRTRGRQPRPAPAPRAPRPARRRHGRHRDHGRWPCGRRPPARTSPRRGRARSGTCRRWWRARRRRRRARPPRGGWRRAARGRRGAPRGRSRRAPTRPVQSPPSSALGLLAGEVGGGGGEPRLDGLEPGGQRIGDRDEAPLLGAARRVSVTRTRSPAAKRRGRRAVRAAVRRPRAGSVARRPRSPGPCPSCTRRVHRVLQPRDVVQRARALLAEGQVERLARRARGRRASRMGTSFVCASVERPRNSAVASVRRPSATTARKSGGSASYFL